MGSLWKVTGSCALVVATLLIAERGHAQECKNPAASERSCIRPDGSVNLVVSFRSPALPAQVAFIEEQFRIANEILCDAADGQLHLGEITLSHGEAAQKDADMWWYPNAGRGHSGFGMDKTNFSVFGYGTETNPCPRPCDSTLPGGDPNGCDPDNDGKADLVGGCDRKLSGGTFACTGCGNVRERTRGTEAIGQVIAHELGHLLFEVGDQYEEQTLGATDAVTGRASTATRSGPRAERPSQ